MFLYQIYVQCSTSCYFLFPYFDRCNCFFLYSNKLLQSQWSKQNDYFSLFVFLSRNPAKHDARATKREDWTTMCMCWCMPHLTLCQLCSFIKYKVFICTGMTGLTQIFSKVSNSYWMSQLSWDSSMLYSESSVLRVKWGSVMLDCLF